MEMPEESHTFGNRGAEKVSKLPGVTQEQLVMRDVRSGVGVLFLLLLGERLLSDHWPLRSCQLCLWDEVQNLNGLLHLVTRCLLLLEDSTACRVSSGTWSR